MGAPCCAGRVTSSTSLALILVVLVRGSPLWPRTPGIVLFVWARGGQRAWRRCAAGCSARDDRARRDVHQDGAGDVDAPRLFAPEMIDELRHLQDGCRRSRSRRRPPIEEELGAARRAVRRVRRAPVAAASVAQVHRARLGDGSEVAVKVLRPDVRRKVERDAAILLGCARVIALRPWRRSPTRSATRAQFVAAIIDQTDLRIEADELRAIPRQLRRHRVSRSPRCTPSSRSSACSRWSSSAAPRSTRCPPASATAKLAETVAYDVQDVLRRWLRARRPASGQHGRAGRRRAGPVRRRAWPSSCTRTC